MQKIMKDECDSKEGKLSFTGLDTAESNLILCKDDANERKASLLLISRVRLILYKDTKFQILYTQNILYMRYMHTEYYNCS